MTTKTMVQINKVIHCQLQLEDGTDFTIPMRNDGYIYATKLCRVGGKEISNWLRLAEVKELISRLEDKMSILRCEERKELVEIAKGGNISKYQQGTWVHPDLGIHLSQWINPAFALQVSKWVRELILTDEVKLGHEKSEAEINKHYEDIIQDLRNKVDRSENVILSMTNECRFLLQKYNKINHAHRAYLRRKELYKLKEGPCVYLINMIGLTDPLDTTSKIKVGCTGDITNRVSGYRTSNPFCKLLFVVYTHDHTMVEKCMKMTYQKNLEPNNSEFITDVPFAEIQAKLESILQMLHVGHTVESAEELEKFNQHNVPEEKVDTIPVDDHYDHNLKRCGGFGHKEEESRMLPREAFFKNKSTSDGYARICKECYLTLQYGDNRKRKKVVSIPDFDVSTHKWCNLCSKVRNQTEFYNDKMTKDGLGSNCKECKATQKREYLQKLKGNVEKT